MLHPDTEIRRINDAMGWGVVATKPIPMGTITWALDPLDQRFTADQVAALPPPARRVLETHGYTDATGCIILCWDHARFFNHHCEANCLSVGYDFELAVRDIGAGEELTDDYGTLNLAEPFPCSCDSLTCRRLLLPDDMVRHGDRWNALASTAFSRIRGVAQPLWEVLSERDLVEAALADPAHLRSIHHHYARHAAGRLR